MLWRGSENEEVARSREVELFPTFEDGLLINNSAAEVVLATDFARCAGGHERGGDFPSGKAARRSGVLEGVGGESGNVVPVAVRLVALSLAEDGVRAIFL